MSEFEPEGVRIHPAATIFPMMDEATYAGFLEDVRKNGLKVNLQFVGDSWAEAQLLDGRNRLKALLELGLSWKTYADLLTIADIPDPVSHVLSLNDHRRHLTESQRGMVAARIANLQLGTNRHEQKLDRPDGQSTIPPITLKEAADKMASSVKTLQRAKIVIRSGNEELIQAVDGGAVKVTTAAKIAQLPKPEQAAAIAQAKQPKAAVVADSVAAEKPASSDEVADKKPVTKPSKGVGIDRAHAAIAELKRIPPGDPQRQQARDIMAGFIRTWK